MMVSRRLVSVSAAMLVVVGLLAGSTSGVAGASSLAQRSLSGVASVGDPDGEGDGVTSLPEARRARPQAPGSRQRVGKQRMPRVEHWTPTTHSVSRGGHTTVKVFSKPAFRRTATGWSRLTGAVVRGPGVFPLRANGTAVPTWFGSSAGSLLRLGTPRGHVEMALVGAAARAPQVARNGRLSRVRYRSVYRGVDAVYDVAPGGVKERLVIGSKDADTSFVFVIRDRRHLLGRVTPDGAGGYAFGGSVGDGLSLGLAAPSAWESGSEFVGAPVADSAHQSVTRTKGGYRVRLWVDPGWLVGKRFPIVLDPTIEYSWLGETMLAAFGPVDANGEACPTECLLGSEEDGSVYVADNSEFGRIDSYFGADLSDIPPWVEVTSATLTVGALEEVGYCSGVPGSLRVSPFTYRLLPGDSWDDVPEEATRYGSSSFGFVSGTSTTHSWPLVASDVTEAVKGWVDSGTGQDASSVSGQGSTAANLRERPGNPTGPRVPGRTGFGPVLQ